ncbi:hypothetical protein RhiirA1_453878 [Rhizophagus irregularis]|uniref:Uncharacterized protein n=1 Tax=Rhizophagus irregularis TaxID=588596 RepID=A0A2N0S6G2_9GLOM|nr:hypothetical protein RhiirA1_453878 [Rhizophagus irregularis]CAB4484727.1 unnamed protein product [Rhizophagus irregularis]CAB5390022.1 unnamed protein product [Rhizophagus irregularis]
MELISESSKIKVGHVTGIMKLVEKLKETQVDSTFSSVEVVTASEFLKFCERNTKEIEKIKETMKTINTKIIGLLSEVERISSSMSGVCKALHQKHILNN